MSESNSGSTRDPIQDLKNLGTGGITVSPLDPAQVRRLGDQRRRRQNTMYGAIAAVVVAVAVIPTALIATKDSSSGPSHTTITPTITPTPKPTPTPTVIVFPDGGVAIKAPEDTDKLEGTSDEFKTFIKGVWQKDHDQGCKTAEVTVFKYSAEGFGYGAVGGCGGYQAVWVLKDGAWKEVLATQDEWVCSDLARYDVPDGFAGECYVPDPAPAVVTFPGDGVAVHQESDAAALQGTTDDFKEFIIGVVADLHADAVKSAEDPGACADPDYAAVYVTKFAQAGYATGDLFLCPGGYSVIWKKIDGTWKKILSTQELWTCGDLTRYEIPLSFAGPLCYGPTELFGPDEDGGLKLGMSAAEVQAAGGEVMGPSDGCRYVYPDLTWTPNSGIPEPAHDSSHILGYLSPSPGKGVVALYAAESQITPEGIRRGDPLTAVEKAYPNGHLQQPQGAWYSPIDSSSYYRFDLETQDGNATSVVRISIVSNDQDCYE